MVETNSRPRRNPEQIAKEKEKLNNHKQANPKPVDNKSTTYSTVQVGIGHCRDQRWRDRLRENALFVSRSVQNAGVAMQQAAVIRQLDAKNEVDVDQMMRLVSLTEGDAAKAEAKAISAIEAANSLYEERSPTSDSFAYGALSGSNDFMQISGDVYSAGGGFAGIRGAGQRLRTLASKTMKVNIKAKLQNAIKYQRLAIGTQVEQHSNTFGSQSTAKKKWRARSKKIVTFICHAANGLELTKDDSKLMRSFDNEALERSELIIHEHRGGLRIVTSYQEKQSEWKEYRRRLEMAKGCRQTSRRRPIASPSPDGLGDKFIKDHPIRVFDYIMQLLKIQEEVPGSRRFTPFPSWKVAMCHAHIDLQILYYMLRDLGDDSDQHELNHWDGEAFRWTDKNFCWHPNRRMLIAKYFDFEKYERGKGDQRMVFHDSAGLTSNGTTISFLFRRQTCSAGSHQSGQVRIRSVPEETTPLCNRLMGFGKHSEETYVEVLRYHPGYAQWCARTATSGSGCEAMVAFVNYLSDVERREICSGP